jgi:hypothetical protein
MTDPRGSRRNRPDAGRDEICGPCAGKGRHDPDVFRRQFWIVLLLTIPVVVWSHEVMVWLGYTAPEFPGSDGCRRSSARSSSPMAAGSSSRAPAPSWVTSSRA